MSTTLEAMALKAWRGWGSYAKATFCTACGELAYCRARRTAGPWLCCDCHDLRGGR
jgi:hypothetical protein